MYGYHDVGNCSNGGIKYKPSALLYISYLAEIKYYESMLNPLIVTFKDVGIFFNMGFPFFSIYTLFFKKTAAILYFCHFSYNIRFLLNIALNLLDVHYFNAKSSEKINYYRQNAQNYYFFRQQRATILYFVIFNII